MTNLFDGRKKRVLHVAPESCFEGPLREALGDNYLTTDLMDPGVMEQMDVTDIQYPDDTFDVIFCGHMPEHVSDDRKAMREIRRVLKRSGWAILLAPVTVEKTVEDPPIAAGLRRGPDYLTRLREADLNVKVSRVADVASSEEVIRMGLTPPSGEIYHCRKG